MNDAEVLAAIRANHLKANISGYEAGNDGAVVQWDEAWLDPGGTIFGAGPYAKVPVRLYSIRTYGSAKEPHTVYDYDAIVVRVYPPERLRKRLAARWAARQIPEGKDG